MAVEGGGERQEVLCCHSPTWEASPHLLSSLSTPPPCRGIRRFVYSGLTTHKFPLPRLKQETNEVVPAFAVAGGNFTAIVVSATRQLAVPAAPQRLFATCQAVASTGCPTRRTKSMRITTHAVQRIADRASQWRLSHLARLRRWLPALS